MLKILIALFFLAPLLNASDRAMFIGVGAWPVYGINESANNERSLGYGLKANAVYTNLLGDYVHLELGLAYAKEKHDQDIPSYFESDM